MICRYTERSAPILGEIREGAGPHERTKLGSREEAFVQKERMNLKRSLWKCEEGKATNMSTLERTTTRKQPWQEAQEQSLSLSLSSRDGLFSANLKQLRPFILFLSHFGDN